MRKKAGSSLVYVLVLTMAFTIMSGAIGSYFLNSMKLNISNNNREEEKYIGKAAVEIGKFYLINEKAYLDFYKEKQKITINPRYIIKKLQNTDKLNEYSYIVNIYNYDLDEETNQDIFTIEAICKSETLEFVYKEKVER